MTTDASLLVRLVIVVMKAIVRLLKRLGGKATVLLDA
jgi:hypothetical protein